VLAASKAGVCKAIARKLSVPLDRVIEDLWRAYVEGDAELDGTPANAFFLTTLPSIPASVLEAIESDQQAKLDARLGGFRALLQMVDSGSDPTPWVRRYLGLDAFASEAPIPLTGQT
jgi:hypothetical protein